VELTPEQAEEHTALDQPILRLMAIARRRPLTQEQFLRLMSLLTTQRIVSNGLAQLRFADVWPGISGRAPTEALIGTLAAPKLRELREILAHVAVGQGRKVVVFSQWRRMLTLAHWAAAGLLAAAGLRAAFFTGNEGQRRRTQNLVEFHDDPAVAVLFATDAGGVGLNLQRAASCCVNLELPWNPAVLEQRIGRIYRHGQTAPVDVYNLVTQDSIEARIAGLVADKRALFAGLFDGESDVVRFDRSASFLARLERLVTPVVPPELPADAVLEPETLEIAAAAEQETAAVVAAAEEGGDVTTPDAVVAAAAAAPPRAPGDGAAPAETRAAPVPTTDAVPADSVRRLFGQLQVRTREDGGVTIDAPPESALALATIFEGMAGLLRAGAGAEASGAPAPSGP
jgi:hypothetical protein